MPNIKEKKTRAKKMTPIKSIRKKIGVRIENKRIQKPAEQEFDLQKKKKIVEQEIINAEKPKDKTGVRPTVNQASTQINELQIEKSKRIIMWSGVTFFMLLIGCIWVYILTGSMNVVSDAGSTNGISTELKDSLAKSMQDLKDSLQAFKDLKNGIASSSTSTIENSAVGGNQASTTNANTAEATTTASTTNFIQASLPRAANVSTSSLGNISKKNDIAELRKKLSELEKKLQEIK
jgi:hypothetical protein